MATIYEVMGIDRKVLGRSIPQDGLNTIDLELWKSGLIPYTDLSECYLLTINLSPSKTINNLQWCQYSPYEQYTYITTKLEPLKECFNLITVAGKCESGMLHTHTMLRPLVKSKSTIYRLIANLRRRLDIGIKGADFKPIRDMMATIRYMKQNAKEWS